MLEPQSKYGGVLCWMSPEVDDDKVNPKILIWLHFFVGHLNLDLLCAYVIGKMIAHLVIV